MRNGRYIFLLALLTLVLFGGSQWLAKDKAEPHKQSQTANKKTAKKVVPQNAEQARRQRKRLPKTQARVVKLYPAGSLAIKQPAPKPALKVKPQPKPTPKRTSETTPPKSIKITRLGQARPVPKVIPVSAPVVRRATTGNRPTLEVGYETIGFRRYIDVMERIGRLFVLVEQDNRIKLGPEVSLKRLALLGNRGIVNGKFALDRPHLIADPYIKEQLSQLPLPDNALRDRVVLVFNSPFDSLLWDVITDVAADNNLQLSDIAQVSGDYISRDNGIFLKLSRAVMKDTLKELSFKRTIRVTL